VFSVVAAIYFAMCWPLSLLAAHMERRAPARSPADFAFLLSFVVPFHSGDTSHAIVPPPARAFAALGLAAPRSTAAPRLRAVRGGLKKKGEINVGMLVDFPPYGTTNAQNQPDGYDADVAKLLAKEWGVKANLVPVTGPNRIPFLLTNKVDLLVASLAVTPERAKQVQFSQPYSAATIVLYGAKKSSIKAAADLKPARGRGPRVHAGRGLTQSRRKAPRSAASTTTHRPCRP
jgi:ABC-type amino acid transport substrate-binding protein